MWSTILQKAFSMVCRTFAMRNTGVQSSIDMCQVLSSHSTVNSAYHPPWPQHPYPVALIIHNLKGSMEKLLVRESVLRGGPICPIMPAIEFDSYHSLWWACSFLQGYIHYQFSNYHACILELNTSVNGWWTVEARLLTVSDRGYRQEKAKMTYVIMD